MRVAVIQLCRMGDIVQTFPVMAALRAAGHEVDLVLRESFAALPVPGSVVDAVHVLPRLDCGPHDGRSSERLEALAALLVRLRARRFDRVLNFSHDAPSCWLSLYLGARDVRGLTADRTRNVVARDAWTHYLLGVPANRRLGALNLADVYARIASVPLEGRPVRVTIPDEARRAARARLAAKGLDKGPRVGLVPGASDLRKRWPAASFAAVAGALTSAGASVVVLGAPDEAAIAEEVTRLSPVPPASLQGETSLEALTAIVSELDLVITNDTGTMHLAASVSTRTLTLTVGPADARESAPYGEGHVTIQSQLHCQPCDFASFCADPVCHERIDPALVVEIATALLFEGRLPQLAPREDVRVLETGFDRAGRLTVRPCARYRPEAEDLLRPLYRRLWETTLGGGAQGVDDDEDLARGGTWDMAGVLPARERLARLVSALERFSELCETTCTTLLGALQVNDQSSDAASAALETLTRQVDLAGQLEPLLRPLTAFTTLKLQLAGARGSDRVVTDLLQALSNAANRARLLQRWTADVIESATSMREAASLAGSVEAIRTSKGARAERRSTSSPV